MNITSKTTNNTDQGTVTITGTLAWDDFATFRAAATKELSDKVTIDGFRKGHIPEDVLVKHVGDMAILEEMSSHAFAHIYPEVLKEHSVDAIGRPQINITKIAQGEDLGFDITTAIMPKIELKDYKKIATKVLKDQDNVEVTDKEIDDSIMQLRKMRHQSTLAKDAEDPTKVPAITDIDEKDLPELDEEYIKSLGEFESIDDFKKKLKENMLKEKESQAHEKTRVAIVDALVEKSDTVIPDMLAQYEMDKMMAQMEHDIAMSGMKFEDYLTHIKKTKEELREEMLPEARKRTHMQMILNHIAVTEELKPDAEKVAEEMKKITEMYKDHKDFNEDRAQQYVESMLLNQAVFDYLEQ